MKVSYKKGCPPTSSVQPGESSPTVFKEQTEGYIRHSTEKAKTGGGREKKKTGQDVHGSRVSLYFSRIQ